MLNFSQFVTFCLPLKRTIMGVEDPFGSGMKESPGPMSETTNPTAQPRMRDVIATLRPQVTFWWGSLMGTVMSAVLVLAMFVLGIFTFNISGVVSIDPKQAALEMQFELEQQGVEISVECPPVIVAPVGFSFECVAATPKGEFSQIDVTIENVIGDLIWSYRYDLTSSE